MASSYIYWTSDGGGAEGGDRARVLFDWIHSQNNADLIVYGGDVYKRGRLQEYGEFLDQIGGDTSLFCETPGNHEYKNRSDDTELAIPVGYEQFWSNHMGAKQPIDQSKQGGARYEHFIDLNGWRLIFLDTGALEYRPAWPMGNNARSEWLQEALGAGGRSRIVFMHHSRLSWGLHGDNAGVDPIWRQLFDDHGNPRAVMTLAGHDHNATVYAPRDRGLGVVDIGRGVQMWVNGAGGAGFYERTAGTAADLYPADPTEEPTYCVTQIELKDDKHARVCLLGLGNPPRSDVTPAVLVDVSYDAT